MSAQLSAAGPPPRAEAARSNGFGFLKTEREFSERKACRVGDHVIALGGLTGFALAYGTRSSWIAFTAGLQSLELLILILCTLIPMVLLSVFGARTHLRHTSGLNPMPGVANISRVATKFLGLLFTVSVLAGAYWLFPEYAKPQYAPVWEAVLLSAVPLMAASWFYMLWVDERMQSPYDGYWVAGCLVLGKWKDLDRKSLQDFAGAWVVKGLFFPYMASVLAGNLTGFQSEPWDFARFDQLYIALLTLIYSLDVLFGTIGYLLTLRILDAHIRSVQPALFGWVVTLLCYAPFSAAISSFIKYRSETDWSTLLIGQPVLFITWGFIILCCLLVYVWSTLSFGCRFSNLTNRGIIRSGPYRWMKHPAYVAKNVAWWLMYLPFCAFTTWEDNLRASLMLACMNLLYYLRAKTEENHLSEDPAYRIYSRWMNRFGLLATLRTIFR